MLFLETYRKLVAAGAPVEDLAAAPLSYYREGGSGRLHAVPRCPGAVMDDLAGQEVTTLAALAATDGSALCSRCAGGATQPALDWLSLLGIAAARLLQLAEILAQHERAPELTEEPVATIAQLRWQIHSAASLRAESQAFNRALPDEFRAWVDALGAHARSVCNELTAQVTAGAGAAVGPDRWLWFPDAHALLRGTRGRPEERWVLCCFHRWPEDGRLARSLLVAVPSGVAERVLLGDGPVDAGPVLPDEPDGLDVLTVRLIAAAAEGSPLREAPAAVVAARGVLTGAGTST